VALSDLVRTLLGRQTEAESSVQAFETHFDSDGVNVVLARPDLSEVEAGRAGVHATTQLIALRMLEEQGFAQAITGGYHVPAESAVVIDDAIAATLGFLTRYEGKLLARVTAYTTSPEFRVKLLAETAADPVPAVRHGATVRVGRAQYRLTPPQFRALLAVEAHTALPPELRTEYANVQLVAELQRAQAEGAAIDLGAFSSGGWNTEHVDRVGVTATMTDSGDLILSPALDIDVDQSLLDRRWGQLQTNSRVLRVENNLLLMDDAAVDAVHEVIKHRRVSKQHVADFLRTPSAFLDASLVDLELGFSVRVEGIGRLTHIDFGETTPSELDWFARADAVPPSLLIEMVRTAEDLAQFERQYEAAQASRAASMEFAGEIIDIRGPEAVAEAVERVKERLEQGIPLQEEAPEKAQRSPDTATEKVGFLLRDAESVESQLHDRAHAAIDAAEVQYAGLAREPFPHQDEGIRWMVGLMEAAWKEPKESLYRLQGALLADDMGLGKTFMSLVAIQQHMQRVEEEEGKDKVKPTLVVAPLSLLENWEDELAKAFNQSPFDDVVVLQSGRDLPQYRVAGAGRESAQLATALDEDGLVRDGELRISLHVGADAGIRRLDRPRRLVLTTYETLRDYQFSLSQIDWGVVVFDEAQAIKTPDTMRTRAAKALKADFKLLATGTPVENNLGEFWCLIDTAQPGLLGDWAAFRERFLLPIAASGADEAAATRVRIGRELYESVGPFMLRRVKEDHLKGLPSKFIHSALGTGPTGEFVAEPSLARDMPAAQAAQYDAHLERFRALSRNGGGPSAALAVLQSLRLCSLHPDLDVRGVRPPLPETSTHSREQIAQSAKLTAMVDVLRAVRERGEKAIVFAISKDLQMLLAVWIQQEFGVRPDVVNGDTSAVSKAGATHGRETRKQILQRFESVPGFNVVIMSPIAAGVGLTVVGANHVIHLERHWNPAKEAQATDRVYRIGQQRDVHVYYPVARHPRIDSFDVLIDRLLASKVSVKDAVMAPEELSEADIAGALTAQ